MTEFLPVSSTDPADKAGVDAFEIVIQAGALLAVVLVL